MLRIDQGTLARRSGVSVETIKRIEKGEGPAAANHATLTRLREALETSGVTLVAGPNGIGISLAPDIRTRRRVRLARVLSQTFAEAFDNAAVADPTFLSQSNEEIAEYLIHKTNWREVIEYQMMDPVEVETKATPRIKA